MLEISVIKTKSKRGDEATCALPSSLMLPHPQPRSRCNTSHPSGSNRKSSTLESVDVWWLRLKPGRPDCTTVPFPRPRPHPLRNEGTWEDSSRESGLARGPKNRLIQLPCERNPPIKGWVTFLRSHSEAAATPEVKPMSGVPRASFPPPPSLWSICEEYPCLIHLSNTFPNLHPSER